MIDTSQYTFNQLLDISGMINSILDSWTQEQLDSWATTYPEGVENLLGGWAYGLISHPD